MAGAGPRRQAREAALQVLFAVDVGHEVDPESAFDEVLREFSLPQRARERALELVRGVAANRKAIDEVISSCSTHWKVERLATVDRNVLRIASYELLFEPSVPAEVVMDEAVEVARRFGGGPSPSFVNGVLDQIAKRRAADEAAPSGRAADEAAE
jgi:N utilization substance protein B